MISNNDKMNELKNEKLALEKKMEVLKIITILEGDAEYCEILRIGRSKGSRDKDWFNLWHKEKSINSKGGIKDAPFVRLTSLSGEAPMELRMELAKVFRKFYGLEE